MDRSQAAVLFFTTAFVASTIGGEVYAAGPCVVGCEILTMAQASPSEGEGSEAGSEGGTPTLPGQPAPERALIVTSDSCPRPVALVIGTGTNSAGQTYTVGMPISTVLADTNTHFVGRCSSASFDEVQTQANESETGSGEAPSAPTVVPDEVLKEADSKVRAAITDNQANLLKIPHVVGVSGSYDPAHPGTDVILITIDDPKNIGEVERRIPSTIEGLDVKIEGRFIQGVLQ
ncbi:MAG: hypothetical protein ACLQDV_02175 [Candidatus Binataceae bacterium]